MNTCKYQRVNSFMTEVLVVKNPAYWFVLQINWTRFCMIRASIMKDSRHSSSTYKESLFLHVVRHILLFFVLVFFSVFFFFMNILDSQDSRWRGRPYIIISFLPLLTTLQTLSWVIAAESSPLRIAGSWNRTRNLWYTLFRNHSFYTCTGSWCC